MTKHAARSIFGGVRDRDAFASRIPRGSSTITAAPTCAASTAATGVRHAPVHRGAVQVGRGGGRAETGSAGTRPPAAASASSACNVRVQRNGSAMISTTGQRRHASRIDVLHLGHRHPVERLVAVRALPHPDHVEVRGRGDGAHQQRGGVVGERPVERDDDLGALGHRPPGRQTRPTHRQVEKLAVHVTRPTDTTSLAGTCSPHASSAATERSSRRGARSRPTRGCRPPSSAGSPPGVPQSLPR